jgi:hypothetical protein
MEAVELVDPKGQLYPALQGPEQAAVVKPAVEPNRPAGQGEQAVMLAVEYVPAPHRIFAASVELHE